MSIDSEDEWKKGGWKYQGIALAMLIGGVAAVLSRWGSWTALIPASIAVAGAAQLVIMFNHRKKISEVFSVNLFILGAR